LGDNGCRSRPWGSQTFPQRADEIMTQILSLLESKKDTVKTQMFFTNQTG